MGSFHGLSSGGVGGGRWKARKKKMRKLTAARAARQTAFFWRRRSLASSVRLPPAISSRSKKERERRRCRVRGAGRGRRGGECEEEEGGFGLLVWHGAAQVGCSLSPFLGRKRKMGRILGRVGVSIGFQKGRSECEFLKAEHCLLLTFNRRPNNGLVNKKCSTLQKFDVRERSGRNSPSWKPFGQATPPANPHRTTRCRQSGASPVDGSVCLGR